MVRRRWTLAISPARGKIQRRLARAESRPGSGSAKRLGGSRAEAAAQAEPGRDQGECKHCHARRFRVRHRVWPGKALLPIDRDQLESDTSYRVIGQEIVVDGPGLGCGGPAAPI